MEVAELAARTRPAALAAERTLPVSAALDGVLPGGLRRGAVFTVAWGTPGAASLLLCLLAGPSRAGSWCAVVGIPELGLLAAAEAGVDLARLAVIPHPGPQRAAVVAALVDSVDVVVLGPAPVRAADARQLTARTRRAASVLLVAGGWPEAADFTLSVVGDPWEGLGPGHGSLSRRCVEVVSRGRRGADRPRRARAWLPA